MSSPKAKKEAAVVATPKAQPLVNLNAYQRAAFWKKWGWLIYLWRRQGRKTTTMASKAIKVMGDTPGALVTYASASILLGTEMIYKEAQIIQSGIEQFRKAVADQNMKLESNGDDLNAEDFADIFQAGKLLLKLHHSRTVYSRTQIIAPNPATARGWSGWVILDEFGFIHDLRELFEAVEPIISTDPNFRMIWATTPPPDDAHFSYDLTVPPEGTIFTPNPKGNFYTSQAGILVHRVDVDDAALAGVKLYDVNSREELTPDQHRAKAIDRDAWDRNYRLIFKAGGTAAVSLAGIHVAMSRSRGACLAFQETIPAGWRENVGGGKVGVGMDVATTVKKKSNPSALAVVEQVGADFYVRLAGRFKTDDPKHSRAMIAEVLDLGDGRRPRRFCIDATSERYFATQIKEEFSDKVVTELVIASENITYHGESLLVKDYLGNLFVNAVDDGKLILPEERWLRDDIRGVTKEGGRFVYTLDPAGNHADVFNAIAHALHALITRAGRAKADAAAVGTFSAGPKPGARWKHPYAALHERQAANRR